MVTRVATTGLMIFTWLSFWCFSRTWGAVSWWQRESTILKVFFMHLAKRVLEVSIPWVKYLRYLKSEVHDEVSCPHLAVPLPLDFRVETEVLSAAEHQTHLVHYIWHWFRGSWKGVRYHQWKWLPLCRPVGGQFAQLFHHLLHLRNRPGCRFIRSHSLRERSCTWSNTPTWWLGWGGGACKPQLEIAGKQSCQFPKASPIGHDLLLQVNA